MLKVYYQSIIRVSLQTSSVSSWNYSHQTLNHWHLRSLPPRVSCWNHHLYFQSWTCRTSKSRHDCHLVYKRWIWIYVLRLIWSLHDRPIFVRLVLVDLISDLCPSLASTILPAKLEAWIPVNSNLPSIHDLEIKAICRLLRLLPGGVLNKAETARCLLHLVESHDEADYLPALAEKLNELPLIRVER